MQQIYLKRLTKQDITRSVAICTESVSSFWGVPITASGYVPIRICHEDKPSYFPEGITIHKGNQGEKDWRICGDKWKKLYDHQNPEDGDIMCVNKNNAAFSVKIIKKGTDEFTHMSKMFVGKDNYVVVQADEKKDESKYPLQQIFYGAPGTGKSHETNRVTREYRDTIRTTFHPDSDYSTFVGAYKPTTTEEKMYGLDSHGKTVRYEYDGKPLETTKIVYKFIPQAFIKAYVQAWKKMAQMTITTHANTIAETILESSTDPKLSWKITKINDQDIYLESCYKLVKEDFKNSAKDLWDKAWKSGKYTQDVFTSFQRHEQTVCNWIYQNLENNNFEEGWDKFIAELNNGTLELQVNPFSDRKVKTFYYHIDGDNIIINATIRTSYDTVSDYYESETEPSSYKKAIANKLKDYHTNDFDEAWQKLEEELEQVDGSRYTIKVESQFLVIEEINRGNCAQIFGDLFQLLDRTKHGFSEYPIEADEDISKYIKEELKELAFNQEITDYINQQFVDGDMNPQTYDIDGKRVHVLDAILNGKILVLPSNLYIWATMNTSDQSLFPIDSAFKRRWDWTYMPIKEAKDKNYKIVLSDSNIEYNWWDFISAINNVINEVTSSEDKKLGYFFCKPCDDKNITASQFVNKVIFYLWNDVFKDYELPNAFKKADGHGHMSFNDFYTKQDECILQLMKNLKVQPDGQAEESEVIEELTEEIEA